MKAQLDDENYPLSLAQLAKKFGREGTAEVRRLQRFLIDREKTLGTEIMTRKKCGKRTTYRVTPSALRRACPEFFAEEPGDPIVVRRIAREVVQEFFEEHIAPRLRVFDERDEAILGAVHDLTRECQLRPIKVN